jgi:hypothetical protein
MDLSSFNRIRQTFMEEMFGYTAIAEQAKLYSDIRVDEHEVAEAPLVPETSTIPSAPQPSEPPVASEAPTAPEEPLPSAFPDAPSTPSPSASPFKKRFSAPAPVIRTKLQLGELIENAKHSPSLGVYIREKAHRCDKVTYRSALFEQGQISRDYWSKLLNDEIRASKEKLLRVAVLLQLNAEEAEEMLNIAGYSLSQANLRDVVVEYCLRQQYYDFVVIEQLLADHLIQSLFNDRRCT